MPDSPAVAAADPAATETSPLLGDQQQHESHPEEAGDATNGHAAAGATNDRGLPAMANKMHLFLPAVGIGMYLSAVDQTLTMASYAKIGSDLNALSSVSWVITSYLLGITSFQPLFGKLSDIFGRKECLLAAYTIFVAGCLGCGLARDMLELCISRAVTGIGAGGINSVVSILVSDLVPLRDRGVWQGYIGLVFAAGMSTGAPLGGILADNIGWRWSFIGQAPLCLIAMVAIYFVLDVPSPERGNLLAKVRSIDFLGALFLVLGISALFYGLDSGSSLGWSKLTTIIPLAALPVIFGIFLFIETKVAVNPFVPGHVIFQRSLLVGFLVSSFNMAGQFSVFFFAPLFLQGVLAYNATASGLLLLPGIVSGVACTLVSGWIVKGSGKYYGLVVLSPIMITLGVLSLETGIRFRSLTGEIVGLVLAMGGGGAGSGALIVALLANAEVEDTAVVIACAFLFRALGSSMGISLSSAVLQQTLRSELAARLPEGDQAREIEERVRQSLEYIKELPPNLAAEVRSSYQFATLKGTIPCLIFAILSVFTAFLIKNKKVNK